MDSEDKDLFAQAMKGVKPLKPSPKKNFESNKPLRTKIIHASKHEEKYNNYKNYALSNPNPEQMYGPECVLKYGQSNVQRNQWLNLKQGKMKIEKTLDLHHHTLDQARNKLPEFIEHAHKNQVKLVLVIHGKGGQDHKPPLMKNHVFHWIKEIKVVLAAHSAAPRHGGLGAIYVLLRK